VDESFIKKDRYTQSAYIDREIFKYLVSRLRQIGFSEVYIVIPSNVISDSGLTIENQKEKRILSEDFMSLDKNFDGLLLLAQNNQSKSEVKILFRKVSNKKLIFDDDVFSYVDKNIKFNLFISSLNPLETYGINTYLKDFFKGYVLRPGLRNFLLSLTIVILSVAMYLLIDDRLNMPLRVGGGGGYYAYGYLFLFSLCLPLVWLQAP
jgi:hypothetical protein